MANKTKIRELLDRLNAYEKANLPDVSSLTEDLINKEISGLREGLSKNPVLKSLEKINNDLSKFKKDFDLKPIMELVNEISRSIDESEKALISSFGERLSALRSELVKSKGESVTFTADRVKDVLNRLSVLKDEITSVSNRKIEMPDFNPQIKESENRIRKMVSSIEESIANTIDSVDKSNADKNKKLQKRIDDLFDILNTLRGQIASLGGGSMNRQIKVGGVDYLTRYTDINFIAGTNVSIAVTNDDVNKNVKITISAAGGAGVQFETPVGDVNDTNTIFTVSNTPVYINVNGLVYTEGNGIFTDYTAGTITLNTPVGTGGFIISAY